MCERARAVWEKTNIITQTFLGPHQKLDLDASSRRVQHFSWLSLQIVISPMIHTFSLYFSSRLCFKITTFPPLCVWNKLFVTAFNHTYMCECKEELCTAKLRNANIFKRKKINLAVIFLCSLLLTMIFVLPLLAELPLQQIRDCKCIGFVWTGFGNGGTTGLASVRSW